MTAQEICNRYANDLFAAKYLNELTQSLLEFERKLKVEDPGTFRKKVMDSIELCWVRNTRPLNWDEDPDFQSAIEQYLDAASND